jgi:hypothetical protein
VIVVINSFSTLGGRELGSFPVLSEFALLAIAVGIFTNYYLVIDIMSIAKGLPHDFTGIIVISLLSFHLSYPRFKYLSIGNRFEMSPEKLPKKYIYYERAQLNQAEQVWIILVIKILLNFCQWVITKTPIII